MQAKQSLEQNMNQIRLAQGELQSKKAEMAQNAIKYYQSQLADIDARNAQFKQSIAQQALAAEQKLLDARTRGSQAAQDYTVSLGDLPQLTNPLNAAGLQIGNADVINGAGGPALKIKGVTPKKDDIASQIDKLAGATY